MTQTIITAVQLIALKNGADDSQLHKVHSDVQGKCSGTTPFFWIDGGVVYPGLLGVVCLAFVDALDYDREST
jgi:hypothetical protein